jgi:hypothetical protein
MELIERRGFPRREGPFQSLVPYLSRIEARGSTSVVITGPGPSRNLTQWMELVLGLRVRFCIATFEPNSGATAYLNRTERVPRGHEPGPSDRVVIRFRSQRRSRLRGPRRSVARTHLGRRDAKGSCWQE